MNLLTLGAASGAVGGMLYPVIRYFVPPSTGAAGGGILAKDSLGKDVTATQFLADHAPGDRVLVQGLKGDPTYLVVTAGGEIENYGINSVCTHLGLCGALERQRKQIHLPLPRLPIRRHRQSGARPCPPLLGIGPC
jgi:Rieske Fe-S protein